MAAHAVRYPLRPALSRRWLRFGARLVLALSALWVLHLAQDRWVLFQEDYSSTFHMDWWLWLAWVGSSAGAGFLSGLGLMLPFSRVHYAWSRLLLATLALLPVAQFWLIWGYYLPSKHHIGGWLYTTSTWFEAVGTQTALAVLGGAAIASGFRAKPREPDLASDAGAPSEAGAAP